MTTPAALTVEQVEIDQLVPCPWNPNDLDAATSGRLRQSLQQLGPIDPLTGVQLADGTVRILDGEHRWAEARALGWTHFPVTILGDELRISPARQRQITLLLNELRGQHDPARTALVIQEIYATAQDEAVVLPYSELRIADLLGQYAAPSTEPYRIDPRTREPGERRQAPARETWQTIAFTMPASALAVVRQALDAARDDGAGDDDWQAAEYICAEYLAGHGVEDEEPDA